MRIILFILFSTLITTRGVAQTAATDHLKVDIDIESAQAICELLLQQKADTVKIRKVAGTYGNKQLIKKVQGYSGAGEEDFVKTLKEIIETGTIKGRDEYNWKLVKANLNDINKLVNYISQNKESFISEVKAIIKPYTPAALKAEARACFLAGGGSLGFMIGGDPTFNVALQKIGYDIEGLKYLVAHEMYHTMQEVGQATRLYEKNDSGVTYQRKASYSLLYNLWAEGIANYVGDMSKSTSTAAFSREQKEYYQKNRERNYQNFQLFEAMLYRQNYDTTARYGDIYDIGFSIAFDETSYFVGYEMAKFLVAQKGDQVIVDLLTKDPIRFTAAYIEEYQKQPNNKNVIRFSSSIERIVADLMKLENKL